MDFLDEFIEKGYFYQCTDIDRLRKLSSEKSIVCYIGFDCTAKSLHVGNLMQIMILRLLQKHGHKPIIIVGGSTTKIGDPSGKDEARKMLTDEIIKENIDGIRESLSKFIKFGDGDSDAKILDNSSWLDSLGYISFLRDFGKEFSVNRMLSMDSVKLRLEREQNLTFLEFNYMLLQAYDYMHLSANHNCNLQIGGSDQWGNIVMGTELIRRKLSKEAFGLTTPLLTTSSGAKMGKSVNGAIWINSSLLSPYDYFQYWRNTEDADVVKFSKLYAEFTPEEQKDFEILAVENINEAKKKLASKVTELCHGKEAALEAVETARKVFEEGGIGNDLPVIEITSQEISEGIPAFELFFRANLSDSKSEARKLIRGGGAKIDNKKINNENDLISDYITIGTPEIKISAGKKKHSILRIL